MEWQPHIESEDPDNRAINNTAGNNDFIIGHRWLAINELNKGFFRALEDNKNLV